MKKDKNSSERSNYGRSSRFLKWTNIFLAISLLLTATNALASEKLIFSVDLIRHGDRAPLHEIPTSPYPWKNGLGKLTDKGIKQEIELGRALRKTYIDKYHLLPDQYDEATMYVQATETHRTIQSANFLLQGLYPEDKRNGKIIPIVVFPLKQDSLLAPKTSHNIFLAVYRKYVDHQAWAMKTATFQSKLHEWSQITGRPITDFEEAGQLGDNLYIRQLHHVPFPKGLSETDAKQLIELREYCIINRYRIKSISRPLGVAFLTKVSNLFNQAIRKETPLKYALFMAHDSTIMNVLNSLDVPLTSVPDYASRLNFSLYEKNNRYFVVVRLNGKPVSIPSCGGDVCSVPEKRSSLHSGPAALF